MKVAANHLRLSTIRPLERCAFLSYLEVLFFNQTRGFEQHQQQQQQQRQRTLIPIPTPMFFLLQQKPKAPGFPQVRHDSRVHWGASHQELNETGFFFHKGQVEASFGEGLGFCVRRCIVLFSRRKSSFKKT